MTRRIFVKKCISEDAIIVFVAEAQLASFVTKCQSQLGLARDQIYSPFILLNASGSNKALVQRLADIRDGDTLLLVPATESTDPDEAAPTGLNETKRLVRTAVESKEDDPRSLSPSLDPLQENELDLSMADHDTSISDVSSNITSRLQTVDSDTEDDEPINPNFL